MKRVLITGENSYIGTSLVSWMSKFKSEYCIDTISVKDNSWMSKDFSKYDTIIHLAAIVHVKENNDELYFKVNRDLAIKIALKAKEDRVGQFIFFSTMSVFGMDGGVVNSSTRLNPRNPYGLSKYEAEVEISKLNTEDFKICILRPPMIYGPNSVGNYAKLSRISKRLFFFPEVNNKRSMLFINNLMCFIKLILDHQLEGTFHPQNLDLVNTSNLVKQIREANGKDIKLISGLNQLITKLSSKIKTLDKVFGTLYYDSSTVGYPGSVYQGVKMDYQEKSFAESIEESEK